MDRRGYVESLKEVKKDGEIIKRSSERIRQKDPRGNHKMFIDIGLNNLFAIAMTNGLGILVKGGFYWEREGYITEHRRRSQNLGLNTWVKYHLSLQRVKAGFHKMMWRARRFRGLYGLPHISLKIAATSITLTYGGSVR